MVTLTSLGIQTHMYHLEANTLTHECTHTLWCAHNHTSTDTHVVFALSYASPPPPPPPPPPSKFTQCSMGEVVLSLFGVFVVGWSCEDNNTVGTHGHVSSQRRCVKSFCRVGAVTVLFQSHDWNISLRHSWLHPSCICPVGGGGGGGGGEGGVRCALMGET